MYKKKLQNEAINHFPYSWALLHVSVCLNFPLPSPILFVRYSPLISFHPNGSPILAPWFPRCRFNSLPSGRRPFCHRLYSGRYSTRWLFPAAIAPAIAVNCVHCLPRGVWPASWLCVVKKWYEQFSSSPDNKAKTIRQPLVPDCICSLLVDIGIVGTYEVHILNKCHNSFANTLMNGGLLVNHHNRFPPARSF